MTYVKIAWFSKNEKEKKNTSKVNMNTVSQRLYGLHANEASSWNEDNFSQTFFYQPLPPESYTLPHLPPFIYLYLKIGKTPASSMRNFFLKSLYFKDQNCYHPFSFHFFCGTKS